MLHREADADRHRERCEDPERQAHRQRPVMGMTLAAVAVAPRAAEDDEHHPEHVEGREERGDGQHGERDRQATDPDAGENLLLREEAAEERDARERQRADQEHDEGLGHHPAQAAHGEDVVGADGVDHRARRQEEQRLEDAVGQEVQEAGGREARADRRHHEAELRDGGVREHPLDVTLRAGEHGGEERGESAHPAHDLEHLRRLIEEPCRPHQEVDARRHHGRRVDQRGDRRRPLHRVGQPHVQGELGGLADGAQVDAEGDGAEPGEGQRLAIHHHEEVEEVERPRLAIQEHDADQEADVARLGRPERLHRRPRRLGPLVPVADQQIGAEPDQLPADEELDEVGREHEPHHREREERLVGVVAAE